jgi:2-polyprenyl-3-methyl-5-hydroxy-6-metoxy-1,4-benzoquinol methylase
MMNLNSRSSEQETMDDLHCSGEVVHQTLRELEFINKWLGGNNVTINALNTLLGALPADRVLSIADLGCGSGDMLIKIAGWAKKNRLDAELTGIDANENIIAYAQRQNGGRKELHFIAENIFSSSFAEREYDIVIGTLFFHHFTDDQLITFFSRLRRQVRIALIINDIHRHPLAYYSIHWLTKLFSKSPMVKHDASLSVARAFRRSELVNILKEAGFVRYTIRWRWAFRWQVVALSN